MEVDKKTSDEYHKRSLRYVAIKFNGAYKVLAYSMPKNSNN